VFESSPLRNAPFRLFYFGSIGTALGYTMQATIAAWLMATLTPSALMVALVQTASTAPSLLFGLIAGALADIVDRRRVILSTQIMLVVGTICVGLATLTGIIGPVSLLIFTFLIGTGFTFYLPAQQASINELVARSELSTAVALGAVAYNVARALGPALAGAIAAWMGTGSGFLVSAAFFTLMIAALYKVKPREPALPGVPERLMAGVMSGIRYARHSPSMRSLIIRNLSFSTCASAFWALLPVIARDQLALGAGGFGLLSAAFGIGAIAGALTLPRQLQGRSLNSVVNAGVMIWSVSILLVAATSTTPVALIGACGAGVAWVTVLASLSAGTQSTAPAWVRARALAVNLVGSQASLALGSAVWGMVASYAGTRVALAVSVAVVLALLLINRNVRVQLGSDADTTPGAQLPEIGIASEPLPDDGPVLIQIEYQIDAAQREPFLRALADIGPTRRRNGATSWRVFRDLGEEGRFVERFIISSWAEYVRLRTRRTMTDSQLQDRVYGMQREGVPVRVSRLIGIDPQSH